MCESVVWSEVRWEGKGTVMAVVPGERPPLNSNTQSMDTRVG